MSVLDESTPFGATVAKRLADEHLIWLTTIGAGDTPQPNPVWFLWEDGTFLIYTEPTAKRLRHLARNPRVALNFNSSAAGGEIAVFTGTARIGEAVSEAVRAGYSRKYTQGFAEIKMSEADFYKTYSIPIHITPDRLRGF
ncbi:TIGR03667 family PPOX class F420-dependent oxidoreductase [Nocardia sp. NPDC055053]